MARPLRIEQIGGWHHVTARGNERREVFRDDKDRQHFVDLLEQAVERFAWRLHGFVLMPHHYHLLVELREANLSRSVHWLNVSHSVWFNRRHGRSGHLLQGRFKSVLGDAQGWGLELSRYLHLNPARVSRLGLGKEQVRRSRSAGAQKPDAQQVRRRIEMLRQYRWSSFRAYIGAVKTPAWLTTARVLGLAGASKNPGERYREYCEAALREGMAESPWSHVIGQTVLGTERFVSELLRKVGQRAGEQKLRRRPGFDQIVGLVEQAQGGKWEQFRDRHGDVGRDLVLYVARTVCGMSLRELSERAGIKYSSAATAVRRFGARALEDRKISGLLNRIKSQLKNE